MKTNCFTLHWNSICSYTYLVKRSVGRKQGEEFREESFLLDKGNENSKQLRNIPSEYKLKVVSFKSNSKTRERINVELEKDPGKEGNIIIMEKVGKTFNRNNTVYDSNNLGIQTLEDKLC